MLKDLLIRAALEIKFYEMLLIFSLELHILDNMWLLFLTAFMLYHVTVHYI